MSERRKYRKALRRARYLDRYWQRGIKFKPGWIRKRNRYGRKSA